jgi:hypothetical protein
MKRGGPIEPVRGVYELSVCDGVCSCTHKWVYDNAVDVEE